MKFKFSRDSLVFKTGAYSFLSFGLAMLLMAFLFIFVTSKQIQELVENENEEHIYATVQQFDNSILRYIQEVEQKASSSTLIKAVMNPDDTKYYLPDYFTELRVSDLSGFFSLLTFDGEVIISRDKAIVPGEGFKYFYYFSESLSKSEQLFYLDDINSVMFVGNVIYQGHTEGFLIYTVKLDSIFKSNEHLFKLKDENYRSFAALYNEEAVLSVGRDHVKNIRSIYPLDLLPIKLEVLTDSKIVEQPVKEILVQIIFFSIIISFFISVLASYITSKNITKPLSALERGIIEVGTGEKQIIPKIQRESIEVKFIRNSFNSILRAFKEKAQDLEYSNGELKRINENLKKTQKQLIQSEKMASIGQLAAGVAHEINNPTGFVTTNLHTMKEYLIVFKNILSEGDKIFSLLKDTEDKRVREVLDIIQNIKDDEDYEFIFNDSKELLIESIDGVGRIKDIVNGLRNFAREDNPDKAVSNINKLIENAIKLTWNELKYKCTIKKEFSALEDISCRGGQLTQVFVNLLVNAAHAIEKNGEIVIKTWENKDWIYTSITDSGAGIPEKNIDKLFDPFFTTKDVGKGTGLGLAISYGIIEEHGGEILVNSKLGTGTTFKISIPKS